MRFVNRLASLFLLAALSLTVVSAQEPVPTPDPCDPYLRDDGSLPYLVGQGNVYFAKGSNDTAITLYTCAIERDATFADAYIRRGAAYYAQGNFDLALTDYNMALELDESDVRGYVNRGIVYMAQGRFGLALGEFDLALALAPNSSLAYNNRAVTHAAEGNYDLALLDVEQAISLAPDDPAPYATRAMIYSGLADASYSQFRERAGETARFPAGDPDVVLNAIRDSREAETFSVWLPALIRAE
jgi:tetratricopeptide (TPR) repeat protein